VDGCGGGGRVGGCLCVCLCMCVCVCVCVCVLAFSNLVFGILSDFDRFVAAEFEVPSSGVKLLSPTAPGPIFLTITGIMAVAVATTTGS